METLRSGMLPRSRPNHIFVDVLDRLPASIRVDLEKKAGRDSAAVERDEARV